MPRSRRAWTHQKSGSYHIISRVADSGVWFTDEEKEYFLTLLEKFASGFYVQVHSFCIMSNHFHILATGMEDDAKHASIDELRERYMRIFGKSAQFPVGRLENDGTVIPDNDAGLERLRARLGSISRFVQELKQNFSRWYNKRHERRGFLWGERFKSVLVSKDRDRGQANKRISFK